MSRLKQGLRLQYLNMKPGFIIFWEIILAIMVFQYVLFYYFSVQRPGGSVVFNSAVGGHLMAVVIFMGVATGTQCWETITYALNLGNTRREFWLSCAVFNFLHSLVMAGILIALSFVERVIFGLIGLEHRFMGMTSTVNAETVLTALIVSFTVIALVAAGVFLFVLLVYRFGWKLLVGLGTALVSSMILFPAFSRAVFGIVEYVFLLAFGQENPWLGVIWLVLLSVACYLLAYPLVKGCQVKN